MVLRFFTVLVLFIAVTISPSFVFSNTGVSLKVECGGGIATIDAMAIFDKDPRTQKIGGTIDIYLDGKVIYSETTESRDWAKTYRYDTTALSGGMYTFMLIANGVDETRGAAASTVEVLKSTGAVSTPVDTKVSADKPKEEKETPAPAAEKSAEEAQVNKDTAAAISTPADTEVSADKQKEEAGSDKAKEKSVPASEKSAKEPPAGP
jgi:hypothetical protein